MTDNEDTKLNGGKHSELTSSESGSTSLTSSLTSSVTSSGTSLECPYCGTNTRSDGEPFPSFQSLRGHIGGAHKVYLNLSQYEAIMKGEQEAPLPPVRSKKSTKKLKVPKTPKGEAVTVPVIEAELDPAQKDRVSEAKKRRTIIDEESKLLEAELRREQLEDRMDNITPWDSGRTRWNRRSRHDGDSGLSKEDFKKMGKMEAQIEQFKESEESVSSQGETITDLMEQLETKDRLMFEQMRLENENRNRDKDRSHDKEMEMMRQMAEDRRLADNRYHELQIASLRTEMKHEGKNDPLVEAVNRGMDSVDRYLGILFSSGSQPPPQLPRVVAPGLVSISEMVAKENPGMVEAWSGESHE